MNYKNNNFIGIFDSGFGGISVLNRCMELMPYENYVFFADTLNCPYGLKSKKQLVMLGDKILSNFDKLKAKEVIIACNTMSTSDMEHFKAKFSHFNITGTFPDFSHIFKSGLVIKDDNITYTKTDGLKINKHHLKLLLIATTATCKSEFAKNLIEQYKHLIDLYVEPADFIVKAVENDKRESFEFRNELNDFFKEYRDIDYLMLGCTHFSFVEKEIKSILKNETIITSGCEVVANNALSYLKSKNLLNISNEPTITIIDYSINGQRKQIYDKLLNKSTQHKIIFTNTF